MADTTKPTRKKFILCPTCDSKSRQLSSEMGGYQTRRCTRGHVFNYDKWIGDRAFWGVVNGRLPNPYGR